MSNFEVKQPKSKNSGEPQNAPVPLHHSFTNFPDEVSLELFFRR